MVDKIIVKPESIRAYGNVLMEDRDINDFRAYKSALFENVAVINGETLRVFHEVYSEYTVGFNFNPGAKELYVSADDDTVITNFSFDNNGKELQFASTLFSFDYDPVLKELYVTDVPTYLFQDDCSSSSRLSEYGDYVSLFGTSGDGTLTYDSTENAYSIAKTTNRDAFTGFQLPITATDNIKITCKVKLSSTSPYNQFGIGIQESTSKYEFIRIRGDKYFDGFKNNTNSSIGSNTNVASFNSAYYYLEISYDGSSRVARVYDNSMSLVKEWDVTTQTYTNPNFYIAINTNSTNAYIKEIKVESI